MATPAAQTPDATMLALERTRLAHERTLMAWVRTAVSLISFGFAIYKFFQFLRGPVTAAAPGHLIGYRGFALIMIAMGLLSLVAATLEHRRNLRARSVHYGAMPRSLAAILAALVSGLGILGLCAVILRQ